MPLSFLHDTSVWVTFLFKINVSLDVLNQKMVRYYVKECIFACMMIKEVLSFCQDTWKLSQIKKILFSYILLMAVIRW
jgi:hypothetical protein